MKYFKQGTISLCGGLPSRYVGLVGFSAAMLACLLGLGFFCCPVSSFAWTCFFCCSVSSFAWTRLLLSHSSARTALD
jgi:hypothetical protein